MFKKLVALLIIFTGFLFSENFSTPIDVSLAASQPSGNVTSPQIAFDPITGNGVCVWSITAGLGAIQSTYTTNGGSSFSTPISLSTSAGSSPQIAFNSNGSGLCVWIQSGVVTAAYTTNGGVSFSIPISISLSGVFSAPQIAFGTGGNGVCVWERSGIVQAAYTTDGGVTFSTPIDITQSGTSSDVKVGYDSTSGNFIVVWYRSGIIQESFSVDNGATYSTPKNISPGSFSFSGGIAIDPTTGHVVVYWIYNDRVQSSYSLDGGATFSTPLDISPIVSNIGEPVMIFDNNGNGVIVWRVQSGGTTIAYESRTADGGASYSSIITLMTIPVSFSIEHTLSFDPTTGNIVYAGAFFDLGVINKYLDVAYSTDGGISFSTVFNLTNVGQQASNPKIAFNNSGNGICVSSVSTNSLSKIEAFYTTDGGASFSTAIDLSQTTQDATVPQIVLNNDRGICVWQKYDGTYSIIQSSYTSDGGATFSIPIDLSLTGQNATIPQVALNNANQAICVWRRSDGSALRIQASYSVNGGTTFSTPTFISTSGNNADIPQIALNDSGVGICVWKEFVGGNFRITSSYTTDGGQSFSTPIYISLPGNNGDKPQIVLNSNGDGICVWEETSYIKASFTTDGGISFSTPVIISQQNAFTPQIVMDNAGNAICVASRNDGANFVIQAYRTNDGGMTWETPVNISLTGQNATVPQIALYNGRAICVWKRNNIVQSSYTTDGGISFSTPQDISASGASIDTVDIALFNSSGYAVWSRGSGSYYTIQLSSTSDGGETFSTPIDLSGAYGRYPQIVAYNDRVIGVWQFTETNNIVIQATHLLTNYTLEVHGTYQIGKSLFEKDVIDGIFWNNIPIASAYRVYDENNNILFHGLGLSYYKHGLKKRVVYNYYVTWFDNYGRESSRVTVTIP